MKNIVKNALRSKHFNSNRFLTGFPIFFPTFSNKTRHLLFCQVKKVGKIIKNWSTWKFFWPWWLFNDFFIFFFFCQVGNVEKKAFYQFSLLFWLYFEFLGGRYIRDSESLYPWQNVRKIAPISRDCGKKYYKWEIGTSQIATSIARC